MWFARAFLANHNDPKPVADTIRKFTKIYPYDFRRRRDAHRRVPGGQSPVRPDQFAAADRVA